MSTFADGFWRHKASVDKDVKETKESDSTQLVSSHLHHGTNLLFPFEHHILVKFFLSHIFKTFGCLSFKSESFLIKILCNICIGLIGVFCINNLSFSFTICLWQNKDLGISINTCSQRADTPYFLVFFDFGIIVFVSWNIKYWIRIEINRDVIWINFLSCFFSFLSLLNRFFFFFFWRWEPATAAFLWAILLWFDFLSSFLKSFFFCFLFGKVFNAFLLKNFQFFME